MRTHKLLLPLAIVAAIGLGACAQESGYDADATADTAAEPADDTMATDPAAQVPPATEPVPVDDSATMADAGAMPSPAPDLATLDANQDGSLSMDELPAGDPWRNQFASADTDGNGMLSQGEIDARATDAAPMGTEDPAVEPADQPVDQ